MFKYVVQSSFYDAWKLTPFLYLAVGFQALSSFYGTGYLSSKDTKGAFTTTVYGAVITIVSNFVLIPKIGLLGASISIFLGYFTMFLARVLQTKKYFLVKLPYKQMLILLLSVALVSGLAFSNNPYFIIANIIIAVSIFIGTNMELIGQYKEKIRVQIMKNRLVAGSN
jgi:O-antigen/teichoic acid export membrane protein